MPWPHLRIKSGPDCEDRYLVHCHSRVRGPGGNCAWEGTGELALLMMAVTFDCTPYFSFVNEPGISMNPLFSLNNYPGRSSFSCSRLGRWLYMGNFPKDLQLRGCS